MSIRVLAILVLAVASVHAQDRTAVPELAPQGKGAAFSYRVAFGGDGRWLAQSSRNGVRIFDTATGRIARELTLSGAAGQGLATIAFAAHPHQDIVVMCDATGALVAFNVATGAQLWRTAGLKLRKSRWPLPLTGDLRFAADGRTIDAAIMATSIGRFGGMSAAAYRRQVSIAGDVIADTEGKGTPYLGIPSLTVSPSFSDDGRWMHVRRRVKDVERVRVRDVRTGRDVGPEMIGSIAASHSATNRLLLSD